MPRQSKFEKWVRENRMTADHVGATKALRNAKKQEAVLRRALDLLLKIRYCTWPAEGLGIGLTPHEIDDVLVDADRLPGNLTIRRETDV